MPVIINGSGSVTGLSVGGLPDGTVDADTLASNAVTSAKLASGVGGKILQVVSTTKTDTVSQNSNSFGNISGMSVTITPSSSSNKILITGYVQVGINASQYRTYIKITGGNSANYIGDATTGVEAANVGVARVSGDNYTQISVPLMYLDSPSTTSAITYQVQWAQENNNTAYLNRPYTLDASGSNVASTITAMEVAA